MRFCRSCLPENDLRLIALVLVPDDRPLECGDADTALGSLANDLVEVVALGLDFDVGLDGPEDQVLLGGTDELDLLTEPRAAGAAMTSIEMGGLSVEGMIGAAVENVLNSHGMYLHNVVRVVVRLTL